MFPELFLERLSYLCEISGRECMQAFCSAWTLNTHHTARLNVIMCSKKEIHCKANYTTCQCVLTRRRERCQGNSFISPNTPDPQQWTMRLQEKCAAKLPATARCDRRRKKSVSEEEEDLRRLLALFRDVAIFSRTGSRDSAMQNIYSFLKAVLLSTYLLRNEFISCVVGKSWCKTQLLQFAAFPMVEWRLFSVGVW